jgi:hypothetical protein
MAISISRFDASEVHLRIMNRPVGGYAPSSVIQLPLALIP